MTKKRMSDKWKCSLLVRWLRKRGISFRIHAFEPRVAHGKHRMYRAARGQAEVHPHYRGRPLIRLWAPATGYRNGWRDLTNAIIHEYGHIALARVPHTEREAWVFGRRAVPRRYVPANYHHRRVRSLATYGAAADRRLAFKDRVK